MAPRQPAARYQFAVATVFSAATAVMLVAAHRQVSYWANSERLFRHALAVTGDNPTSCESLGDTLLRHDRYAEAEVQFRKVLEMAAKEFRQTPAELARALEKQERIDEAISCLRDGIRVNEDNAEAMNELARLLAQYHWRTVGALPEAIDLLKKAMKAAPDRPEVAKNLAWIYATCPEPGFRNGLKAVELARRACELTDWSNAAYRVALADGYHEVGDREHEIEELRAAQKLSPKDASIATRLKTMSNEKGDK
jgi:tetratricopeptide (TPR) repeat protein